MPPTVYAAQAQVYRSLFTGVVQRPSVTSVTVWGVNDGLSWLNSFPVLRRNYPLLFVPNGQIKSAIRTVTDLAYMI